MQVRAEIPSSAPHITRYLIHLDHVACLEHKVAHGSLHPGRQMVGQPEGRAGAHCFHERVANGAANGVVLFVASDLLVQFGLLGATIMRQRGGMRSSDSPTTE